MYKICNTVSDLLEYINNSKQNINLSADYYMCAVIDIDIECRNHHEHDSKVDNASSVNDSTAGLVVFFFCFISLIFLISADVGFIRKWRTWLILVVSQKLHTACVSSNLFLPSGS